jgi:hypothetical protein
MVIPPILSSRKQTIHAGNDVVGKREPQTSLYVGCKLMQPVWRFIKKIKIDLPYNPAIPLLGIYLNEYKSTYKSNSYTPIVITVLFIIAITLEVA